ncbi:MAG: hypothetical protein M3220_13635 [Chloroflexota bacterium]|nr:hypothetical protein [Chloroflexota bacterium]
MATHPLLESLKKSPSRAAEHEAWTMEADGAEVGPIGIKADSLRLRRSTPSKRNAKALGEDVAERTKYLLEPLEVVESDEQQAILRSRDPEVKEEGCDYYEMWVKPDEVSVERYQGAVGKKRESRPVNMTWEQAERFVKDVDAVYDTLPEEG